MNYKIYYSLSEQFKTNLKKYVISNNCVDASFYISLAFINKMDNKAFNNNEYLKTSLKWFKGGSTLELKDALYPLGFKDEDLKHFNAMALLDSVSLINS